MARIDDTIATYLIAIEVENKRPRTIDSYAESLEDFRSVGRRLGLPDAVEEYAAEHVYQFLDALRKRGAWPGYQNRRHREVQTLFSWCERMGYVPDNVFKRVPRVKLEQKIKPPFSRAEIQRMLDGLGHSRLKGCREYPLILFLLDTGVRVSECIVIRLEDVDWEQGQVRETKNHEERWGGISERTLAALRDYIDRFRGERVGPLFLTSQGAPMASGNTVRVILRRIAAGTGIAQVHPHRFRYTFATWAIESGAREFDVQYLLGHKSLAMVQRYSRTYTSKQAVRAHAALSPVGQIGPAAGNATADGVDAATDGGVGGNAAPAAGGNIDEARAPDLLSSPSRVSRVAALRADGASADAPLIREGERVTTTKSAIKAGQTLVAKYRRESYTCEVVEQDERLYFVLPGREVLKGPSAAGKAVTGTATNGYRFWSIPDKSPAGQAARQHARQAAAENAA